jgi:hypothetical protein
MKLPATYHGAICFAEGAASAAKVESVKVKIVPDFH